MLNSILAQKQKMNQTFVEDTRVPVTWIKVGPCLVTQIKNLAKDGYWAVQLGFGTRKAKNTPKSLQGHLKKIQNYPRYLREIRSDKELEVKVGDQIKVSEIFKKGDLVEVQGTSKGKGFAGVVKRWHFAGGPKTHGQSDRQRAPGAIGQGTTPGRVHKGKKMAGRLGQQKVTIKNLIIVDINEEKNEMALSGPVPGSTGDLLIVKKIASGKLKELVEEAPQIQVHEGEVKEEESLEGATQVKEEKEVSQNE